MGWVIEMTLIWILVHYAIKGIDAYRQRRRLRKLDREAETAGSHKWVNPHVTLTGDTPLQFPKNKKRA